MRGKTAPEHHNRCFTCQVDVSHMAVMSSVDTLKPTQSPLCLLLPQGQGFIFSSCLHGRWARYCDAVDAHTPPFLCS